jgi:HSP20 family protein
MPALTPWTGSTSLRREIDRIFERFLDASPSEAIEVGSEWTPTADVSETKDTVVVRAELPGVEQRDISVTIQDAFLTIKGEKRHEKTEKDERHHRVERSYGSFARSMRLPSTVDASQVTASFKDGVLTVTLPKTASARGTSIPIKQA